VTIAPELAMGLIALGVVIAVVFSLSTMGRSARLGRDGGPIVGGPHHPSRDGDDDGDGD
jgi:hypothetical protein